MSAHTHDDSWGFIQTVRSQMKFKEGELARQGATDPKLRWFKLPSHRWAQLYDALEATLTDNLYQDPMLRSLGIQHVFLDGIPVIRDEEDV